MAERAASSNAIHSAAATFAGDASDEANVASIAESVGLGGGGPVLVGGPERIADELEAWAAEADLDGFNLAYAVMPETFADVVDHVVPELQRRGVYKDSYQVGTHREKLFGQGPQFGERHRASGHRRQAPT